MGLQRQPLVANETLSMASHSIFMTEHLRIDPTYPMRPHCKTMEILMPDLHLVTYVIYLRDTTLAFER